MIDKVLSSYNSVSKTSAPTSPKWAEMISLLGFWEN